MRTKTRPRKLGGGNGTGGSSSVVVASSATSASSLRLQASFLIVLHRIPRAMNNSSHDEEIISQQKNQEERDHNTTTTTNGIGKQENEEEIDEECILVKAMFQQDSENGGVGATAMMTTVSHYGNNNNNSLFRIPSSWTVQRVQDFVLDNIAPRDWKLQQQNSNYNNNSNKSSMRLLGMVQDYNPLNSSSSSRNSFYNKRQLQAVPLHLSIRQVWTPNSCLVFECTTSRLKPSRHPGTLNTSGGVGSRSAATAIVPATAATVATAPAIAAPAASTTATARPPGLQPCLRPRKKSARKSCASITTTTTSLPVSITPFATTTTAAAKTISTTTKKRKMQHSVGSKEEENLFLYSEESTSSSWACEFSDHDEDDDDDEELVCDKGILEDDMVGCSVGGVAEKQNHGTAAAAVTSRTLRPRRRNNNHVEAAAQPVQPGLKFGEYSNHDQRMQKKKVITSDEHLRFKRPLRYYLKRQHGHCNDTDDDDGSGSNENLRFKGPLSHKIQRFLHHCNDDVNNVNEDDATASRTRSSSHRSTSSRRKRRHHHSRIGAGAVPGAAVAPDNDIIDIIATRTRSRQRSTSQRAGAAVAPAGGDDDGDDDDDEVIHTRTRSRRSSTLSQRKLHHQHTPIKTVGRTVPRRAAATAAAGIAASTVYSNDEDETDSDDDNAFPRNVAAASRSAAHKASSDSDDDDDDSGPVSRKGLPDIYIEGAELCMGESNRFAYYTHDNDTLLKIAQRYKGVSSQQLLRNNQNALPGLTTRSKLKPYTCIVMPAQRQHFGVDKNGGNNDSNATDNISDNDFMAYGPRLSRDGLCDMDEEGSTLLLQESNRFVYYACNNDTPHQIAKRFHVPVDRILFDNAKAYPGMTRHCKLKPFTCIVMPV